MGSLEITTLAFAARDSCAVTDRPSRVAAPGGRMRIHTYSRARDVPGTHEEDFGL